MQRIILAGNNTLLIDGNRVPFEQETFTILNSMAVMVGTNGSQGGDAGHGSRTYIRLQDISGTDFSARAFGRMGSNYGNGGVEIVFAGDSELHVAIEMFQYIADTLKKQADRARECNRPVCAKWLLDNEE